MTTKAFKTKAKHGQVLDFKLDDDLFNFTPPKFAITLLAVVNAGTEDPIAQVRAILNWLSDGLPEEQNARLIARLTDPEDDLDFPDLEGVFEYLMEQVTGRPTKPQSA